MTITKTTQANNSAVLFGEISSKLIMVAID